uniref:Uncharacterized protein n=1 Tax=Tanacetum cinerariifolium TaxID=118510 RepID=A0A699K880_TANCI|nr:hypothetical protein [Tanacetum cinerariifolium]
MVSMVQASSSQPQKTYKPSKPKRKNTQVPRSHGDTTAQTRFESVSKHSNDLLLARCNTLQSDEDRLKLNKLMELCTNLQTRVIDLEKTKTTQANEIDSLKKRVKKLERRNNSRTHKLKRLYKVGLTARVESSDNEESLGEDASKQERRIDDIDADEDITLVDVQADAKMFDDDVQAKTNADYQLAERLQAQEQEELTDAEKATLFVQLLEKRRKHFAVKRAKEKRNKPPTQAQKRKIMCTYLKNMERYKFNQLKSFEFDEIQEMFDRVFKRVNTFEPIRSELVKEKEKRAEEELEQERSKNQKGDLKTMFEPHVEDAIWRKQQGYKVLK